MKKERKNLLWKILIIMTFLSSLTCLIILIPKPQYEYYTELIELNNSNTGYRDGKVVSWTCDDNVYVSRFTISKNWFYSSTWKDGKIPHSEGRCFVKIREFRGWK